MADPKFVDRSAKDAPWRLLHEIADRSEPAMRRAWLQAVSNSRDGVPVKKTAEALQRNDIDQAVRYALQAWEKNGPEWRAAVQAEYARILQSVAAPAVAKRLLEKVLPEAGYSLNLTNPKVWEQIGKQIQTWFEDLDASIRTVIRQSVTDGFREGFHPYEMARRMRSSIGLDERGLKAVQNYEAFLRRLSERKTLMELPKSITERLRRSDIRLFSRKDLNEDRIVRLVEKYRLRLIRERAVLFSRTATMAASNEAQRQLWLEGLANGQLNRNEVEIEAITTPDDRMCEKCASMDGLRREIDGVYTGGAYSGAAGPIWHFKCRCVEGPVQKEIPTK